MDSEVAASSGPVGMHPERPSNLAVGELRRRPDLGDVLIDDLGLSATVERTHGFRRTEGVSQVAAAELDFVSIARRDGYFRETLNAAELAGWRSAMRTPCDAGLDDSIERAWWQRLGTSAVLVGAGIGWTSLWVATVVATPLSLALGRRVLDAVHDHHDDL